MDLNEELNRVVDDAEQTLLDSQQERESKLASIGYTEVDFSDLVTTKKVLFKNSVSMNQFISKIISLTAMNDPRLIEIVRGLREDNLSLNSEELPRISRKQISTSQIFDILERNSPVRYDKKK